MVQSQRMADQEGGSLKGTLKEKAASCRTLSSTLEDKSDLETTDFKLGESDVLRKESSKSCSNHLPNLEDENYDGASGVYLGPSRTLDEYELEYLSGEIEERQEIPDSYRPPSPLSLDSFSGIYIGPDEKKKKETQEVTEVQEAREAQEPEVTEPPVEEEVASSSRPARELSPTASEEDIPKSVQKEDDEGKKKRRRGKFFFLSQYSKPAAPADRNIDPRKNMCFKMFKKSINLTEKD